MRKLNTEQFAAYANTQIEKANQILARHLPAAHGSCSCGKQLPCSVAAHATATRDRYQAKLALLDATQVLPVLVPTPVVTRPALWRRLLRGVR